MGALVFLLSTGCSVLFESSLPPGCTIEDEDGDGHIAPECADVPSNADCDDQDPTTYPGAPELCNFFDDDCDGRVDEGLPTQDYVADCDLDGYGDDHGFIQQFCEEPAELGCPDGGGQWVHDVGDCDDLDPGRQLFCGSCAQVDLLIVMDTSPSMAEEQRALSQQLPWMVEVLASGDFDGDGVRDVEPIEDLQVGVVTPDLGTGRFTVPTCAMGFGEDGALRRTSGAPSECAGFTIAAPYLEFSPRDTETEISDFVEDWSCLVRAGTDGCAFEQPLEAALKALTPAASPIRFRDDTLGHGDGLNRGFLRDGSLLVVLFVTDGDDCSAADAELFKPESTTYPGDLGLRCFQYPGAVHPITRYVSGLLQLRAAEDLIVGLVAGVPADLVPAPLAEPDYESILGDTRLAERIDSGDPGRLAFSCGIPGRGGAFPPRRLLELADGLQLRGTTTVLSSICSPDAYQSITEAVLSAAVEVSGRRCATSSGQ